jgi:sterol desaturase/sphingolipid hydroxylase (fatty acid hydroxylase superfamily)
VNRTRLVGLLPYAATGVMAALIAFVASSVFAPYIPDLWSRAAGFAQAKWHSPAGLFLMGTALLLIMELVFLRWEKTTVFLVFFRRSASALVDAASVVVYFVATLKMVVESVFTFGVAYAIAHLMDVAAVRYDWTRWHMPSEGVLGIAASVVVYYLANTFVGYWQHRMMHWRWFWHLHRFHHAATEINIFTSFRTSPAEAFRFIPFAIPLFFVKPPSAEMFAFFTVANQLLALLQHSELPWSLGWLGRWLIVSPQYHQIHHSMDEEHRDLNFSVCPIWDRLFGTWYSGSKAPSSYGTQDGMHVERPFTQWILDIGMFYRDVARSLAGVMSRLQARTGLQGAPSQDRSIPHQYRPSRARPMSERDRYPSGEPRSLAAENGVGVTVPAGHLSGVKSVTARLGRLRRYAAALAWSVQRWRRSSLWSGRPKPLEL